MMKHSDRSLGMHRRITRRDLLHGFGAAAAASFVPGQTFAEQILAAEASAYPPALTGLRGSHVGSFEVSHELGRGGRRDWGSVNRPDADVYDLVVVGAGISGLSAAHFYLQDNPDARILILDNHDDFGGHAKRNEFDVGGRGLIGYGGSQTLEDPYDYNAPTRRLLKDIGVDLEFFENAYDDEFYKRHGLAGAVHFNGDVFGKDRLVRYDLGGLSNYLDLAPGLSPADAVRQMPIAENARRQMLHVLSSTDDCLADIPVGEKENYLYSITYRDFLEKHMNVSEPDVFAAFQNLATDSTVGIESASAGGALFYVSLPGHQALGIPDEESGQPYIHHFPDGNASIARLLVRRMIPDVAPGSTMEDIVLAPFDYAKLDDAGSPVRLRLNSTAVRVENDGSPSSSKSVRVTYVKDGRACQVQSRNCVLACYNAMIPHLCPELPEKQREALALQVKAPILYTSVALNNWRAWEKLGVGAISCSGSYHANALLDFPVSMGGYEFAGNPDEAITVHMERFPNRPYEGLTRREEYRLGAYELLATPFETMERNIREQLAAALSDGGFDPGRDIAGITVNRWAHGYAYGYNWLEDPYYGNRNDERYPHVIGRQPFGRISIANSDSGAAASLPSAVVQAHRAVAELG